MLALQMLLSSFAIGMNSVPLTLTTSPHNWTLLACGAHIRNVLIPSTTSTGRNAGMSSTGSMVAPGRGVCAATEAAAKIETSNEHRVMSPLSTVEILFSADLAGTAVPQA